MFKLLRPLLLFLSALTYAFGASLADYLGKPFRVESFWLGLIIVVLLQTTMNLLPEVYRPHNEPLVENETRIGRRNLRNNTLYVSMAALASVAVLAYVLYNARLLPLSGFYFLTASLIVIIAYSIPPFRFLNRGFGEIFLAIQLAYIVPSFSFTLQNTQTHRFLLLTLPIAFLTFAYFIILNFQTFSQDQKYERVTFLTRLGWERVVPLHHIFVLFAYIFLLTMPAIKLSYSLVAPAFLTLPFAIFQVIQLRNIALGAKPNWLLLHVTALSVLGLTTYFLTFTFWTR